MGKQIIDGLSEQANLDPIYHDVNQARIILAASPGREVAGCYNHLARNHGFIDQVVYMGFANPRINASSLKTAMGYVLQAQFGTSTFYANAANAENVTKQLADAMAAGVEIYLPSIQSSIQAERSINRSTRALALSRGFTHMKFYLAYADVPAAGSELNLQKRNVLTQLDKQARSHAWPDLHIDWANADSELVTERDRLHIEFMRTPNLRIESDCMAQIRQLYSENKLHSPDDFIAAGIIAGSRHTRVEVRDEKNAVEPDYVLLHKL